MVSEIERFNRSQNRPNTQNDEMPTSLNFYFKCDFDKTNFFRFPMKFPVFIYLTDLA